MKRAVSLIKDHAKMRLMLEGMRDGIGEFSKAGEVVKFFKELEGVWDAHEKEEEGYFEEFVNEGAKFPMKSVFISEHRDFKGHWKIIKEAIDSDDAMRILAALETDGKMLIDKMIEHMDKEDDFLHRFIAKD